MAGLAVFVSRRCFSAEAFRLLPKPPNSDSRRIQGWPLSSSPGAHSILGRNGENQEAHLRASATTHPQHSRPVCPVNSGDPIRRALLATSSRGMNWTSVMTLKTLHFLCRALFGFNYQDPPVPIDGKVIRGYVWPGFRIGIPPPQRPQDWEGDSFAAYCRYMTAVLEWARKKNWTTTQVQATIFEENK